VLSGIGYKASPLIEILGSFKDSMRKTCWVSDANVSKTSDANKLSNEKLPNFCAATS
jgi:hypothetical protein